MAEVPKMDFLASLASGNGSQINLIKKKRRFQVLKVNLKTAQYVLLLLAEL